jgi:hypothetical protein
MLLTATVMLVVAITAELTFAQGPNPQPSAPKKKPEGSLVQPLIDHVKDLGKAEEEMRKLRERRGIKSDAPRVPPAPPTPAPPQR